MDASSKEVPETDLTKEDTPKRKTGLLTHIKEVIQHKWHELKELIEPESEKPLVFDVKMGRLTPEIIDLAYEEAIRRLDNQQESMAKAQQQIQTFLGWYLAAIISLIGILTGQMIDDSGSSFVILMSLYGIIVLGAASFCFWRGALFKTEYQPSGDEPAHFLSDEMVSWLEKLPDDKWWPESRKYVYLREMQKYININRKRSELTRNLYRKGVAITVVGIALLLVFLIARYLFLLCC